MLNYFQKIFPVRQVGASVRLIPVQAAAREWEVEESDMAVFLAGLQVPVVKGPDGGRYFNLFALEMALFMATRLRGPGLPRALLDKRVLEEMAVASALHPAMTMEEVRAYLCSLRPKEKQKRGPRRKRVDVKSKAD